MAMPKRKSAEVATEKMSELAEFEQGEGKQKRYKHEKPSANSSCGESNDITPPKKKAKKTSTLISQKPHDGTKNDKGKLVFSDFPDFQPNRTPKEVLHAGSFGGTYFRPIYSSVTKQNYGPEVWEELPEDWLKGLKVKRQVASPNYNNQINKFQVKCGGSLEMWESSGWIKEQDPYGWFQWYCRFFQGRRTKDDQRQIDRWNKCAGKKGRWRNNLVTKVFMSSKRFNDPAVSPVVRQTLLHWGYELTKEDYDAQAKVVAKRKGM